jgi:hypothetical protein
VERRRLGRWLVWAGGLSGYLINPDVAGAAEKARLVYVRGDGAQDCPDEVKLRLWVVARLGYDPFSPQASNVVIARVEARDAQLAGNVEIVDAQGVSAGRRELASPGSGCQALARAMALSISLAIDPERANRAGPAPIESEPEARQPSEAKPSEATPPPTELSLIRAPTPAAGKSRASPRVFGGGAFVTNLGALPAAAFGGELALGLRLRRWSLELQGRALQSTDRDVAPRGQVSGSIFGAGMSACWHFDPFAACLVGQAGLQRLSSSGVTHADSSSGLYGAVGPRLVGHAPLGPLVALELGLEGTLNLAPPRVILSGKEVWAAPRFGATLLAGVTTHFL